ncbi:anthranilate synthase component II [Staphylococcus saccharolyticus]|uniref:anthranilate synthase component II n=1 Tax=Staphylococcus saccharolyticus TaxID=33028 RepID=UPI00102D9EE8|nr:aminodeoxychorismate/anthranilate synthase component II [Staphylococcus saccharolyticus]MBL7584715.1 aminodeoxychorismate/anthranilate synthase component II [Staphylococcus saccharolyticus]MBL7638320.1 aminodeoxychorismate/anthranilate synthase component II [Staphylococcus saccharolyticus]QRJ68171.1 aminodeoxychorismate/anthranilate synthase component II [Staphylococcus saccharolyticus]TAA93243.1 aminodeoxychorismate/anthranilate synthase component II [Staphylococcus saccharolyticus]TAA9420
MIIMIDNHDSFTYNLIDYIKVQTHEEIKVISVDHVSVKFIEYLNPRAIIISPGPGRPSDYPVLSTLLEKFHSYTPILGVCLGFQLIVEFYGGQITHNDKPIHGHTTKIHHCNEGIFKGLPSSFNVMRYHSLMAVNSSIPSELKITAKNDEEIIMAVEHCDYPVYGVQYHPESILSEYGHAQVNLFLTEAGVRCAY